MGFEPTIGCPIRDFQSRSFDHSDTTPRRLNYGLFLEPALEELDGLDELYGLYGLDGLDGLDG